MKSNIAKIIAAICCIAAIGYLVYDEVSVRQEVSMLTPQAQQVISTYAEEHPKLRVGDLVEVTNIDDTATHRVLIVDEWQNREAILRDLNDKSPQGKGEVLSLPSGIHAAVDMTKKYAFHFIRQGSPGWLANANTYWIQ